jgi:DNA-binding PadR family transcriptional regulator
MHTNHHDPFAGGRRRGYRDPFASPSPRRRRGQFPGGGFDPDAAPGPRGRRGSGFGPGAAFGPGFGPDFGPGFGFGPEFGPGRGHGHRGGRRAGRGDIRTAILLLLAEQPRHGYELIREIADRTDGVWRPSPGAVYPALQLLEDEGLVAIAAEGGRRLASLTEAGQAYVAEHADELGDPFAQAAARTPHPARALRTAVQGLMGATWQLAQTGDESQVAAAQAIVERATKDLYMVLAGEQPTQS